MAANSIKKNDTVRVISGDCRGMTGKVLSVSPKSGRIVVEGVNKGIKHVKGQGDSGRVSRELPFHISNVVKGK
jgi:large subunit ribosomal protein L24